MHTLFDCIPCFQRQIRHLCALLANSSPDLQQRIQAECNDLLPKTPPSYPPPELAARIYARAARIAGNNDPFAGHKYAANARVLELLPSLQAKVAASSDPLETALRFSIIGNYIDAGVGEEFEWEEALADDLAHAALGGYPVLQKLLDSGLPKILILGDNAGEIGMDTLLVQELQKRGAQVTYAVRGTPILNDATLEDAYLVGMDRLCRVVSSGVDSPGTILARCDSDFLTELYTAPAIISKGQGNLESLHGQIQGTIFYALKVKCPVVAEMTGFPIHTSVFDLLA